MSPQFFSERKVQLVALQYLAIQANLQLFAGDLESSYGLLELIHLCGVGLEL
jgi:hypothetical protein